MSKKKIGFLGPPGTFSEEALFSAVRPDELEPVPLMSIHEVVAAVERRDVDKGIVPIENSIEGSVNVTLDMLAFEANLLIEREIVTPVVNNLIGRRGTKRDQVKTVISHPQAAAQCRGFIVREFPGVRIEAANSTAEAVRLVAEREGREAVAIGTALAAQLYGLNVLERKIQDFPDNRTRFVFIGREMPAPTGYDKTSIVCFIHEDRPGSLLQILQEFAFRSINLTKIQSRPTRKALGEYCFFLDLEGHVEDEDVAEALKCLRCKIRQVKLLGSYPRARVRKA
ncbi:MAG: prephenate dehydratase [Actinomycetota bacterium]|nr:prephenate dehydratase [Actinomycetota bacterium]